MTNSIAITCIILQHFTNVSYRPIQIDTRRCACPFNHSVCLEKHYEPVYSDTNKVKIITIREVIGAQISHRGITNICVKTNILSTLEQEVAIEP